MEIRRQQVMEDLREQQELKRLYTHFDQVIVCSIGVFVRVRFPFHDAC